MHAAAAACHPSWTAARHGFIPAGGTLSHPSWLVGHHRRLHPDRGAAIPHLLILGLRSRLQPRCQGPERPVLIRVVDRLACQCCRGLYDLTALGGRRDVRSDGARRLGLQDEPVEFLSGDDPVLVRVYSVEELVPGPPLRLLLDFGGLICSLPRPRLPPRGRPGAAAPRRDRRALREGVTAPWEVERPLHPEAAVPPHSELGIGRAPDLRVRLGTRELLLGLVELPHPVLRARPLLQQLLVHHLNVPD
mmetsp:Transcript_105771/g.336822  ORF Transcript_105771/g.336822 Transcript_105771/m.336822 type:complete len:248 (-) Transcript_105771:655-1398(-)